MSFDKKQFGRITSSESSQIQTIYGYNLDLAVTDDLATITASAYFNDLIDPQGNTFIKQGDLIAFRATDATGALRPVGAISPNITLTTLS